MAYVFRRGKYWYIRYKDEAGKWQKKSAGKKANKADAEFLAKTYTTKELNYHHKAPVRIITSTVSKSLETFRDEELPKSSVGIDKQESSIRREKAAVNNIIEFVDKEGLKQFRHFTKDEIEEYMTHRKKTAAQKTRKEELRLLKKFFKWAIKKYLCVDNPAEDIIPPKIEKKLPRFFSKEELLAIFMLAKGT